MNKSKRIAISLVAGVLAALLCMAYGSSIRSRAEQVQAETLAKYGGDRVEVCVAARDIDVGETLDETNVITQEWLTSLLPRDAATELRQVRGDVTTSRIPKNAVICNVYTKAESHKLEVPKGKVAVSVAVDAEHSVGGRGQLRGCVCAKRRRDRSAVRRVRDRYQRGFRCHARGQDRMGDAGG